jgi:hypothetical protein
VLLSFDIESGALGIRANYAWNLQEDEKEAISESCQSMSKCKAHIARLPLF